MTRTVAMLTLCLLAGPAPAADPLTPKQLADGWVKLFDGESTFGWPKGGTVEGGKLVLTAPIDKELTAYYPALCHQSVEFHYENALKGTPEGKLPKFIIEAPGPEPRDGSTGLLRGTDGQAVTTDDYTLNMTYRGGLVGKITVPPGGKLVVTKFNVKFHDTKPIFDGKSLDGWKLYAGDPKRERSKFDVTAEGELRVTDGPGDLQTTSKYADFLLRFDCQTRGKNLNSGVFFRCLPGEYQAGYEAQVHNGFAGDDRTKPLDFGTGAIYRRVPARKVVSNDNEWFTMTLLAVGPTIRTWVNGEPVVNWTDDRPRDENARKGLRTAAGHLSIQGHDPTTDILFRNLRVLDIK